MKYRFLFSVIFLGLLFVGCRNKHSHEYISPEDLAMFSGSDTSAVISLVNQYIECLNSHDYDGMVDMLYYVEQSRIHHYEGAQRDSVKRGLQQIPIYAAKMYSFCLRDNINNEVGILVQLIENGDLDNEIGVSKLYLNPVQFDSEWYLTLRDLNAEGVHK